MSDAKILVTADEAAKMLSIGKSTFWREVKVGNLPKPIKVGSITRWRVADLQRCVADQASQTTTASDPVAA
jgi:predicted DNA-binding transcriptional regulator AlpA